MIKSGAYGLISIQLKAELVLSMPLFQVKIQECEDIFLPLDDLAYSIHGLTLQMTHWDLRQVKIRSSPTIPRLAIPSTEIVVAGKMNVIELAFTSKPVSISSLCIRSNEPLIERVSEIVEVGVKGRGTG